MLGMTTNHDPGTSGVKEIAEALGGGIRENSLVIIEGEAKTGKSVLCQHIAFGVLHSKGGAVAYYSSDYNSQTLVAQMDSMCLDIRHDLVTDLLRTYKMATANALQEPDKFFKLIFKHVEALPPRFKLIIIDSISELMLRLNSTVKMDFLQTYKEMCERERSFILTLHPHVLENKIKIRIYEMSDYYLRLASPNMMLGKGQIDTRVIKTLEVIKLAGAERHNQEILRFEIKPRVGMQILPFVKIKV